MNTYLITFKEYSYDQYDAFVVVAEDEEKAVAILQKRHSVDRKIFGLVDWSEGYTIEPVDTTTAGIVLGSFNAG